MTDPIKLAAQQVKVPTPKPSWEIRLATALIRIITGVLALGGFALMAGGLVGLVYIGYSWIIAWMK